MDKEKFLTPADIVKITGMKLNTVQGWCKSKRLPAEKVNRHWHIKPEDLADFLDDKSQKKRVFNYSAEAVAKVRAKKKAGTLKKITNELIEEVEQTRLRRLEIVRKRFPEPQEPGVIKEWILECMPTGIMPRERTSILDIKRIMSWKHKVPNNKK